MTISKDITIIDSFLLFFFNCPNGEIMARVVPIDRHHLEELMVFVEEFEQMVEPAKDKSLIKIMESIDPTGVDAKQKPRGKSLREDYSKEIFTPAQHIRHKVSEINGKSQETISSSDFTGVLQGFDSLIHETGRYLEILYSFIRNSVDLPIELAKPSISDIFNSDKIQDYCAFEGNYNNFIRNYKRYRLKLRQKYFFTEPQLSLVKRIGIP